MRLTRYSDLAAFSSRAEPLLLTHEAEHCLPIGLLTILARGEMPLTQPPYLALVEDDAGQVVEVALATPPFNLILSRLAPGAEAATDEILRLFAEDVREAMPELPGVNGADSMALRFSAVWTTLTGERARLHMHERLYQLTRVNPARPVPGLMRRIEESDRALLTEWLRAFNAEALGLQENHLIESNINRRLRFESSGMYLWQTESSGAVALAGYSGPTPHGIRIGPVYTPPALRGQGYASALVAALSQRLLDEGRQFVSLFTNQANPTSNHIYQAIGYEPINDVSLFLFERPEA